jgi:subtilase family serine protease
VQNPKWIVPASSVQRPEDAGKFAHTNIVLGNTKGLELEAGNLVTAGPNATVTHFETPHSLGCVYKIPNLSGSSTYCYPGTFAAAAGSGGPSKGGWGAIALVDAYDNPDAASNLAAFDSYLGLPAANFVKVYANGNGSCTTPPTNTGWGLEESLDIEWAHAMAPQATIILVEACSNSYTDLLYAEYVAGAYVASYGGGDISNSWGSGEFSGQTSDDLYFFYYYWNYISYFASAGDSGLGAAYPSSSPWVVSAGGTTVNRLSTNLHWKSETCWAGSGGGTSAYETWGGAFATGMGPWTAFQYPIFGQNPRSTPDLSFDADPSSGVVVYDAFYSPTQGNWWQVGGTSVSSPSLAGIVNSAGNQLGQAPHGGGYYSAEENSLIYSQYSATAAFKKNFYDVKAGSNGASAGPGWDYCTGVGTPRGLLGE